MPVLIVTVNAGLDVNAGHVCSKIPDGRWSFWPNVPSLWAARNIFQERLQNKRRSRAIIAPPDLERPKGLELVCGLGSLIWADVQG